MKNLIRACPSYLLFLVPFTATVAYGAYRALALLESVQG